MKDFNRLSQRQQNMMRFISNYTQERGFPPSIREIGEECDIGSTSVVNYNLNKLVDAGYIERSGKVSRGLRIVGAIPGLTSGPRVFGAPGRSGWRWWGESPRANPFPCPMILDIMLRKTTSLPCRRKCSAVTMRAKYSH